ncbi:MAG TPA: hypothetical protein VFS20_08830 [Longimicrobium sp.]|nr:hypothetical protein [Longimicrobium sp.]
MPAGRFDIRDFGDWLGRINRGNDHTKSLFADYWLRSVTAMGVRKKHRIEKSAQADCVPL